MIKLYYQAMVCQIYMKMRTYLNYFFNNSKTDIYNNIFNICGTDPNYGLKINSIDNLKYPTHDDISCIYIDFS